MQSNLLSTAYTMSKKCTTNATDFKEKITVILYLKYVLYVTR